MSMIPVESSRAPCTCGRLRRASRALTQLYDDAMAPAGLRVTQFSLLRALARGGPLRISELAARQLLDRTALSRNLDPLVDAGYVDIVRGRDARTREVAITPMGAAALGPRNPTGLPPSARSRIAWGRRSSRRWLRFSARSNRCIRQRQRHPHPGPLPRAGEGATSLTPPSPRAGGPDPPPQAGVGARPGLDDDHERNSQPFLAQPAGGAGLRQPDPDAGPGHPPRLRPVPAADLRGPALDARDLRPGDRRAEPRVGCDAAVRGDARRQAWRGSGRRRRRPAVRAGPDPDGAHGIAVRIRVVGRGADRHRHVGRDVQRHCRRTGRVPSRPRSAAWCWAYRPPQGRSGSSPCCR